MLHHNRNLIASLFQIGVRAAEPERIAEQAVRKRLPDFLGKPVTIIATGKAAIPMMQGAQKALDGAKITKAIVVTNRENLVPLVGVDVLPSGHPVPDLEGMVAAQRIIEVVGALSEEDVLLFLVSGGTSAMLPAPAGALSFQDEIAATEELLASGAPIDAVNIVRSCLSRVKGGGLSQMAGRAMVVTLMLSDVPGDDPAAIGSGPTIPTEISREKLSEVMRIYGLEDRFNEAVLHHLKNIEKHSPVPVGSRVAEVIGSNKKSLDAVFSDATKFGVRVEIVADWLDGDVEDAAVRFADAAKNCGQRPAILIAGGETTVQLVGNGKGGRNQELALRFATHMQDTPGPWVFLSGGTDGRDGPTDAAGGLIDHNSLARIGVERLKQALDNNDAYHALESSGDLLMTGGTGTNVADLQILLLGEISADI
ncbi:MAG: DUF4147 domain-containing protein [Pseudomonadota bacterium]